MTATKACQGTGVSGWEKARVWDLVWARVGVRVGNWLPPNHNPTFSRVRIRIRVTLTLTLKWGGVRARARKS